MNEVLAQQILAFQGHEELSFANFLLENNEACVASLQQLVAQQGERFIYVWGASGTGKTHLLHACCQGAGERDLAAIYLPMAEHKKFSPRVIEDLEVTPLCLIDDVEQVIGKVEWEEALFHLYNRFQQNHCSLVIASRLTQKSLGVQLPDLESRFCQGLTFQLAQLPDEAKLVALQEAARQRGMTLTEEVGNFMLRRCPRSMSVLKNILQSLDHASLAAQRRLTIPFVKEVLGL